MHALVFICVSGGEHAQHCLLLPSPFGAGSEQDLGSAIRASAAPTRAPASQNQRAAQGAGLGGAAARIVAETLLAVEKGIKESGLGSQAAKTSAVFFR